ncbi:hypothetical protein SBRCBS47491_002621 [Sporothrix bragantina]|uniref:Pathway-specific nitrogen regulator n=1 Tax=Sporothrix bragantina TaxID=671064 RepID=A0ABP0B993_9PEZI
MADDILLDHTIANHQEASSEETILNKPLIEADEEETHTALPHDNTHHTDEDEDDTSVSEAEFDADNHGVANVVAAIDAFLAEPNGLDGDSQIESHDEHDDDDHSEANEAGLCLVEDTQDEGDCQSEAQPEVATEETIKLQDELREEEAASSLAATVEDEPLEETSELVPVEAEASHHVSHAKGEQEDTSNVSEKATEHQEEPSNETVEMTSEDVAEHSNHKGEDVHDEHSFIDNDEADVSMAESTSSSHVTELEAAHEDEETHEELHQEPHKDELHEESHVTPHEESHEQAHEEARQEIDEEVKGEEQAKQSAIHDSILDEEVSRRSSTSSSRSGGSNRRTSLRTEALIQAAARAVVAKINETNPTNDHYNFDIMSAMSESHEDAQDDGSHDRHTATDEDGENDHERDCEFDEDDVFSDRSPRSSLGSFEHNSGASNNGASDDQQKTSYAEEDTAGHMESEDEHDYVDDTGSVTYHSRQSLDDRHRSPRLSTVSGISHMSQYEQHQEHDEDEYDDGEDFVPHTIRGTPRAAFRTPSSVRAIQMSSPSPSMIFGVSPRSAARRRRLGTGSGLDDGQSMGSVGTYSSLPGSPSKNHTPTRFKVFRKPEPAPLVLLHATLMPTRWLWSDVLRTLDERLSSNNKNGSKDDITSPEDEQMDASSFEPSAALKRLHGAWCQLQEYSLGGDTVAERGVLLPHPQNDYEVLEERLLEALELPVRRRARILECGHYLGPADEDDDEFDDDDDYYNDGPSYRDESDSPNKRHWCTTCRSDIRYESLGAERVFRVKVYASNGLMTVGAWAACWSEMERVDVEIEPIVADAALVRELNQLRTLQQLEAIRKQDEDDEAAAAAAAAEEAEFGGDEHDEHNEHDKHDDLLHDDDLFHNHKMHMEHMGHTEHEETAQPLATVDHFHLALPSTIPVSPPLRDSPVEPPAITTTDRASDAERRQREAEERLREIYGRTPPQAIPSVAPSSQSHLMDTARLSDVPETDETTAARDLHDEHLPYRPSPPSPSAEAFERLEKRRNRQVPSSDRGIPIDATGHAATYDAAAFPHQPQTPYESASLPELLVAAGRVFMRDRKHVAITVLSIIVILLATLRSPSAGGVGITATPGGVIGSVKSQVLDAHPGVDHRPPRDGGIEVTQKRADVASLVTDDIVKSVMPMDTLVETVVEKMTVKVYETVTETATETSTSTETSTATATEVATTTAAVDISATEMVETATIEAFESAEQANPTHAIAEEGPSTSAPAPSLSASKEAELLFAKTCAPTSAARSSHYDDDESFYDEL